MANSVKIRILDKIYDVSCAPGKEAYVADLGKRFNEKAHLISGVINGKSTEEYILVTALFLMEEVMNMKEASASTTLSLDQIEGLADITRKIEAIAERMASLHGLD